MKNPIHKNPPAYLKRENFGFKNAFKKPTKRPTTQGFN
jgi:hypothetical protein